MTRAASSLDSRMRSMPASVFWSDWTPFAASADICSESRAVSLALVSTWPMLRSICLMLNEVSSVEPPSSSMAFATSRMLRVISSMAAVVSWTLAAICSTPWATSSLPRAISAMRAELSSAVCWSASTCAATSWCVPIASAIERLVSVTCDWMLAAPELTWAPERESWSMTEPTPSLTLRTRASVSRRPWAMRLSAPARTASSAPPSRVTVWVRSASPIRRAAARISPSGRVRTSRLSTRSTAAKARKPTTMARTRVRPSWLSTPASSPRWMAASSLASWET